MSQSPGFVDLRIQGAGHGSHTDDSVWPSFTDIMTVIVMIFLMALAVILIKNTELVTQLEQSVQQERQAAELARSQSEQRASLEKRLTEMERQIAEIKLRLFNTEQERDETTRQLNVSQEELEALKADFIALKALRNRLEVERDKLIEQNQSLGAELSAVRDSEQALADEKRNLAIEVNALENLRDQLRQELAELSARNTALTASGEQLEQQVATLQQEKSSLTDKTEELEMIARNLGARVDSLERRNIDLRIEKDKTQNQFDSLSAIYSALQTENLSLEERIEKAGEQLAEITRALEEQGAELKLTEVQLQDQTRKTEVAESSLNELSEEYVDLQERYLKLVGPARSELDRVVADIRYTKRGGSFRVEYRGPGETGFRTVNRSELDRLLSLLNQEHPRNVYTRIIIPDDSGLSYNEAWTFTNDILTRYDYYYQ